MVKVCFLIHPSAWKKNSRNFALTEFSEVVASISQLCCLVGKRSAGKRVGGEGEQKACDE
jgi:hypothetical protein